MEDELFEALAKKLVYLTKDRIDQIQSAYLMACEAHFGQKRSTGDEYISHPIAVATILADMRMDAESVMAALLHDVIEDTALDKVTVARKFGTAVADLVDGVTKLSKIQFSTAAEAQAESFRKMVLAMSHDIRVILVKLADRLHNMRTLDGLPLYKQKRIARETLEIYAPIAHRLGIHDLFVELENLAFLAVYPRRYCIIQNAVTQTNGNRSEIISLAGKAINDRLILAKLSMVKVVGREKQIYSIYKKMRRKHLSFSEVTDVYGFRVIVGTLEECYLALGVVHGLYKPIPGKFKDYIAIPKINGYQSLHTVLFGPHGVPIEIQIRTEEMDQLASKGIAAHWLYKTDEKLGDAHIRAQLWINNLLEIQQKTGNSLEFVENVKVDLFPDVIYVFTPKGRILELPRNSTIVDFAYAVHTDIGNRCVSARVDRKLVSLSTELISGQTVAIIQAPGAVPNPAWLNFVKTAKARSAIRHFLKNQKLTEAIALGKQLLDKALSDLSISLAQVSQEVIVKVLQENQLTDLDDLYANVGLGNKVAVFLARQLVYTGKEEPEISVVEEDRPLLIEGAEGMVVHFAKCCCPVPGDPIIACVSSGRGLIVHTSSCKKIDRLRSQPEKCVLVRWSDDIKGDFLVIVTVDMSSKLGSFATLTRVIADAGASIEDIVINRRTGEHYSTILKILVRNREHLQRVLHSIANLNIVSKVARI